MSLFTAAEVEDDRALAESRMLDTFDIKVPTGGYVYDTTSKTDVEAFDLLFTTRGRVKVSGGVALSVGDAEAGGRTVATVTRELHLPVDSPAVPTGALAVCTAVDASSDSTLLGAHLRIEGPTPGSQTTARRLQVTEVLS